ncbi:MAG: FKBP-type peptidyl-prolyl cis-trans isomerase [Halobacteria archaeon]|nr:FKBP-type peptidyl-prolyl cis-trans isomerase [Halobacteria archaeon]
MAKEVEKGDTVTVEYVGKLEDGEVFDTSRRDVAEDEEIIDPERDYEPLEFEVGEGEMIEGFDEGVVGMEVGDTHEIEVAPEKGYGERSDEDVFEYEYDEFAEMIGEDPEEGMHVHAEGGACGNVTRVEEDEDEVEVDFNHALAGERLFFEVEVIDAE